MKAQLEIPTSREGRIYHVNHSLSPGQEHTHDELEVNLVTSGTARYLIDSVDCPLHPGSLVWLFPEQEHLLLEASSNFAMWVVVFRPALVRRACRRPENQLLRSTHPRTILHRILSDCSRELLDAGLRNLTESETDADYANAAFAFYLLECWRLFQAGIEPSEATTLHPAVFKAVRLLNRGSADLAQIAREAGLSPNRLSRIFHAQIGQSLSAYRNTQRLKQFDRLRRAKPNNTLLALALEAGFGSYAQFHRVYREHRGKPPSET